MADNKFPVISFVTPTYNAQRCLERCLKSIRTQDYPQENIEIIIGDGGSTDKTLEIAAAYNARIYPNPRRLAEYGLAIAVQHAGGDFFVLAASDNELIGRDWLTRMLLPFKKDSRVSAAWGRMLSSRDDPSINHYYALIQNDPLTFFTNQNLRRYLHQTAPIHDSGQSYYIFDVSADMPLPWGANCLIYRSIDVRHFWQRDEYIGDNDVFQLMLESGKTRIAYNENLTLYHHTVGNLFDWIGKWRRNLGQHFLVNRKTRNLRWITVKHFKLKLMLWVVYSFLLPVSVIHSIFLAVINRNIYWLYHPWVSLAQACTYIYVVVGTKKGWQLIFDLARGKPL
jgi:glycosyltransferase involved in cell wall biosynthesis